MLRYFSKIDNVPVISIRSSATLAKIEDLFIDYKTGKVIAVYVKVSGLFWAKIMLIFADSIIEWSNGVYVQSDDAITDPDDLVRYTKEIEDDYSIFGLKVYTKKGKYLGRVDDVLIETVTMTLRKMQVTKKTMWNKTELLIPMKEVESITPQKIIVKHDTRKVHLKVRARSEVPATE